MTSHSKPLSLHVRWGILALLLLPSLCPLMAQWPVAMTVVHSDSFREWNLFDEADEIIGVIRPVWDMGDRQHSEWNYELGEASGRIRLRWPQDLNLWEISSEGFVFTARTKWPNNFTEWEIRGHQLQATIRAQHPLIREDWVISRGNVGAFSMYTTEEGDLRDWQAYDEFQENVPAHFKLLLMFVVMFNSALLR